MLPILRSIRLCNTAYGMLYLIRCLWVIWSPDHPPATYRVQHTISCITQSNAPEDGQNYCPKHVELIWVYLKTVIVASSWLFSLPSLLTMHGQTNIKVKNSLKMAWTNAEMSWRWNMNSLQTACFGCWFTKSDVKHDARSAQRHNKELHRVRSLRHVVTTAIRCDGMG